MRSAANRARIARALTLLATLAALCSFAPAAYAASARVAALQAALRARGLYRGTVDGLMGPATGAATRAFQARAGLRIDGVAGPRTRRALGRLGRHPIGSRPLRAGAVGWDVAALQFKLERHGFPCGTVDGGMGARTVQALVGFQAFTGLARDGIAGRASWAALRSAPPRAPYGLFRPIAAPVGDRYGPRGAGFHAGLDFPAPTGTPVTAAARGVVVEAGYNDGFGLTVVVSHLGGVATRYAHLSAITTFRGAFVAAGRRIGRVGATGFATGPHLHFEVTVRGAHVDPLSAL